MVDTFLLSCRVLGRGVEHRMLAALGRAAQTEGLADGGSALRARSAQHAGAAVSGERRAGVPAGGSGPALLPFSHRARRGLRYKPAGPAAPSRERAAPPAAPRTGAGPLRAHRHRTARSEESAGAHPGAGPRPSSNGASYAPPRTELERRLAEIWAEALRVSPVGIHDDFFDLGGHSLLAVQLMSRVRQEFGVDLSLELVYSGEFTVAELAEAIEVKEIERSGGDRYEALLRGTGSALRRRGARAAGEGRRSAMRILLTASYNVTAPSRMSAPHGVTASPGMWGGTPVSERVPLDPLLGSELQAGRRGRRLRTWGSAPH